MKRLNATMTLLFLVLISCGQTKTQSKINETAEIIKRLEELKLKDKFLPDSTIFYPGIANIEIRPVLEKIINKAVDDFITVAKSKEITDEKYQEQIEIGLKRFKEYYINLDTEDRERICTYFEEMMGVVGLESSKGLLNMFMYGFDPDK